MIIRHGEEVIIRDVEDETTGEKINLNVAQYISYDLSLDNLHFTNPMYARILEEAVEHSHDESFKAEEYFTRHPDLQLSTLAIQLSADEFKLSKSLEVKQHENYLRDQVMHLVLDFRMDWVDKNLKALRAQLSTLHDNVEQMMQVMGEYKRMQDIRNVLARRLGSDIVV